MNMYASAHILHYVVFVKNQPRILSFEPQSCRSVNMFLLRAETTCGASLRQSAEKRNSFLQDFCRLRTEDIKKIKVRT